ncbi:hypothetical protein TNIN_85911 [Trichonephila inaurata madagascariensis]|uniref:Uncharacterized protein n=1 Tax=Trichonephila inaurata madagascariensis TaxID=2747483 RepID=A0A8X6MJ85_9ARAC|nr:hypothetical protein TNIN_85911 [Trichonephila inaurata madagascariensis]
MLSPYQSGECLPEVWVEISVDEWIQSRVEISKPKEQREETRVRIARSAESHEKSHNKEGQPADDEHPSDDDQRLSSLFFPFRFHGVSRTLLYLRGSLLKKQTVRM